MHSLRADSEQLDRLRVRFRKAHPDKQATPVRLGMFARRHGIVVSDFGSHSRRWIDLFNGARTKSARGLRPVELFNP